MKAPDFDYLRPANLADAIALLVQHDGDAMPLAGGQSLMPMMNFRVAAPGALVDLVDVAELRGVTVEDATLRIGAMTRYVDLMNDNDVCKAAPLIGMALPHVAHDAIRNRGTLGGSLALADAAAEMPAVMLVLDAAFEIAGPGGTQIIKADKFFLGHYETALAEDELITAIHIPVSTPDHSFGFHELTQRHGDYALAGVAVSRRNSTYRCAFFGVADRALRVAELEAALSDGSDIADALHHLSAIDFTDDIKANAATRQRLAGIALTRAIEGMQT